MNPEDGFPLGVRLSLAFLRFVRLVMILVVLASLMGGGIAAWLLGATGGDVHDGVTACLIGLGGLGIASLFHGGALLVELLGDQIQTTHHSGQSTAGPNTSWQKPYFRSLLVSCESMIWFVFVPQVVLALGLGLANGFNGCRLGSLLLAPLLVLSLKFGLSLARRRLEASGQSALEGTS